MRFSRRFLILLPLVPMLGASGLRADLVWSADKGWRVEGGALVTAIGEEGRNALELMNQARLAEEHDRDKRALKTYKKVSRDYAKSIYAPEADYRAALLYLKRRDFARSFNSYQQIVSNYPNYDRFSTVIGDQYRIASALGEGARGRIFWGLLPGFRNREQAVTFFEKIIENAPYSDYAPLALMNVARLRQKMRDQGEAIDALDRMINFYPQSILTPDAYLKLAQAYSSLVDGPEYDQAATKEAVTAFQDFMILYPGDPNVGDAEKGLTEMKIVLASSKIRLAEFYHYRRANYVAAKVLYNEAITVYPDSEIAKKARTRLTEIEPKILAQEEARKKAIAAAKAAAKEKKRPKFLGLF